MNFESFINEVKTTIKDYLPKEYQSARIDIRPYNNLNKSYVGMTVRAKKQQIAPTINLNLYYEKYCNFQLEMRDIIVDMAATIQKTPEDMNLECLTNYELAKENLFIQISDVKRNQHVLNDMPYTIIENLAITYHIYMGFDGSQMASTTINNRMLQGFGITKEQLHQDALNNSPRLFPVKMESLDDIVEQKMREDMRASGWSDEEIDIKLKENGVFCKSPLIAVSNNIHINGAAAIFYPGQLDKIGTRVEGNYYILPSSTHEMLVLPEEGDEDYRKMKEMVIDVNNNYVLPNEKLTDEVYHYDVTSKIFEKAISYEERQMLLCYEQTE